MKSLPIHLNRLDKALRAQGVVFKRHQLLETCAAAFGFHNSNEATAAAKRGDLNPSSAQATSRFELGDGQHLIVLLDPVANAPFAVDETFLEHQDAGDGPMFGVSPYGHLLDLTTALTSDLQTLAAVAGTLDQGREIAFKLHTASIDHRHGTSTFTSHTKEGVEAEVEAWCSNYWSEVAHRYPEGSVPQGAELIDAYFEAHEQEFLSYDETTIYLTISDILAAVGKTPTRERAACRPPGPVSTVADPVDPWADHPIYGSDDWRHEVSNGDTRQSYSEWVASRIEQDQEQGSPEVLLAAQDYPEGHEGPLCLTNGCCEAAHGGPQLFARHGLSWSTRDDGSFYPLTDDEARFIAEEQIHLPNGYAAELGYSFLFRGEKYASGVVEVAFDANSTASRGAALDEVKAYAAHVEKSAKPLGGHVFITEDDAQGDRHTLHALVPFRVVQQQAIDFADWKIQIARILMPADGPRVVASFHPQAWVNDYAIDVDVDGEAEWDVTAEIIAMGEEKALGIDDDSDDTDALTGSKHAPEFVRNWQGPYRVEVEAQIGAYFAQISLR
ncbi:MAG: hypothetical protein DI537_10070 [Stutzerimonas stutzeri]|nr:MAG: hypothetical protein DI537_10070 [Stutzerimonas stutzeri]